MKKMTKGEMKKVMGGVVQYPYTCTCTDGSVGQWVYKNGDPSEAQVAIDVASYCSSNKANCGHYPPAVE